MGTHAVIAVRNKKGITAIGVNSDGGVNHTGVILAGWYNTPEKVKALIALGHLSQLNERIAPNKNEEHSWAKPAKGVTIASHRDRGEPLRILGTFEQKKELTGFAEYVYLFDNGRWLVWGIGNRSEWIELKVTADERK